MRVELAPPWTRSPCALSSLRSGNGLLGLVCMFFFAPLGLTHPNRPSMGAGTSNLEHVVLNLDKELAAHRTDYNLFPSSDGVALRKKVNAMDAAAGVDVSRVNDLANALGVDAALGVAGTGLFHRVNVMYKELQTLKEDGLGTAAEAGAVADLANALGVDAALGVAGTGLFHHVNVMYEELQTLKEDGLSTAAEAGVVADLANALGVDAAPGVAGTGLFHRVNPYTKSCKR